MGQAFKSIFGDKKYDLKTHLVLLMSSLFSARRFGINFNRNLEGTKLPALLGSQRPRSLAPLSHGSHGVFMHFPSRFQIGSMPKGWF